MPKMMYSAAKCVTLSFLTIANKLYNSPEGAKVGADPTLTGAPIWEQWVKNLARSGKKLTLVPLVKNPIDTVWEDPPPRSKAELEIHELKYAGKYKLNETRFSCFI